MAISDEKKKVQFPVFNPNTTAPKIRLPVINTSTQAAVPVGNTNTASVRIPVINTNTAAQPVVSNTNTGATSVRNPDANVQELKMVNPYAINTPVGNTNTGSTQSQSASTGGNPFAAISGFYKVGNKLLEPAKERVSQATTDYGKLGQIGQTVQEIGGILGAGAQYAGNKLYENVVYPAAEGLIGPKGITDAGLEPPAEAEKPNRLTVNKALAGYTPNFGGLNQEIPSGGDTQFVDSQIPAAQPTTYPELTNLPGLNPRRQPVEDLPVRNEPGFKTPTALRQTSFDNGDLYGLENRINVVPAFNEQQAKDEARLQVLDHLKGLKAQGHDIGPLLAQAGITGTPSVPLPAVSQYRQELNERNANVGKFANDFTRSSAFRNMSPGRQAAFIAKRERNELLGEQNAASNQIARSNAEQAAALAEAKNKNALAIAGQAQDAQNSRAQAEILGKAGIAQFKEAAALARQREKLTTERQTAQDQRLNEQFDTRAFEEFQDKPNVLFMYQQLLRAGRPASEAYAGAVKLASEEE